MTQQFIPMRPPMSDDEWRERMLANARQTRSAVRFIAWVIGIGVIVSVLIGVIAAVQLARIGNDVNTGGGGNSFFCQSQGGTVSGC